MSNARCFFVLFDHDGDRVDGRIAVDPEVYMRYDADVIIANGRMYVRNERSQRYVRAVIYDHDKQTEQDGGRGGGIAGKDPKDDAGPTESSGEGTNHGTPTT